MVNDVTSTENKRAKSTMLTNSVELAKDDPSKWVWLWSHKCTECSPVYRLEQKSPRLTCNVQYIYYSRFTCLVFTVLIMFPDPGKCSHKAASQKPIITLAVPLQPYKYGCTGVKFANSTQQLPLYYVSMMSIEL